MIMCAIINVYYTCYSLNRRKQQYELARKGVTESERSD